MALLITVFSCDKCGKIIGLKSESDWKTFESEWSDGVVRQFCPNCKTIPAAQNLIEQEKQVFLNAVKNYEVNSEVIQ